MKKLTIEIQFDDSEVAALLSDAMDLAEWARVTGDNNYTVIRGELQIPADSIRHYATVNRQAGVKGGCW